MTKKTLTPLMIEFATNAWTYRDELLEMGIPRRTRAIYKIYNHGLVRAYPDWRTYLMAAEVAFGAMNAGRGFSVQGERDEYSGADFGAQFAVLRKIAEAPLALHTGLKISSDQRDSEDSRAKLLEAQTAADRTDPARLLGAFLWSKKRPVPNHCKYRIYLTPRIVAGPMVFSDLVRFINGTSEPGHARPREAKLSVPGPDGSSGRSDRIVIYCGGDEELRTGIEWLRTYQARYDGMFENFSPLGTKTVEGLKGVAITDQPVPKYEVARHAGIDKRLLPGMSFGMSRAMLLAIALDNVTSLNEFKQKLLKVASKAKVDLSMQDIDGVLAGPAKKKRGFFGKIPFF